MLSDDLAARVRANLARIEARVAEACRAAGRARDEVLLLAVSKEQPLESLCALHDAGVRDFGENRVQAYVQRTMDLAARADIRWHLIGPVQTNKARFLAEHRPALLHTVDRDALVAALEKRLDAGDPPLPCLLELNVDREPQKAGVLPEGLDALADRVAASPRLALRGVMAIPAQGERDAVRAAFDRVRQAAETVRDRVSGGPPVLSMGMSGDFEDAIACGSTLVRVGTALFGPRGQRC
ncbi:MAG: YggS family pyridoxal phosphate-dependent enzyme [Deltaproteobacteria bacterium]|nr:YggS family pyridoxal phosphate-dependent enzyme [Deltaproteobacteria bacterium]